jgi:hypothetical protein
MPPFSFSFLRPARIPAVTSATTSHILVCRIAIGPLVMALLACTLVSVGETSLSIRFATLSIGVYATFVLAVTCILTSLSWAPRTRAWV